MASRSRRCIWISAAGYLSVRLWAHARPAEQADDEELSSAQAVRMLAVDENYIRRVPSSRMCVLSLSFSRAGADDAPILAAASNLAWPGSA